MMFISSVTKICSWFKSYQWRTGTGIW